MNKCILFLLCCLVFPALFLCDGRALSIAATVNYIYDKAGRLTKAKYDNGTTIEYTYDNAGNLLEKKVSDSANECTVKSMLRPAASKSWKQQNGLLPKGLCVIYFQPSLHCFYKAS